MEHPLFEVRTLSDDDIFERLTKSHRYLQMQRSLGHSATAQSIEIVIEALQTEQQRRMILQREAAQQKRKSKTATTSDTIELGTLSKDEDNE